MGPEGPQQQGLLQQPKPQGPKKSGITQNIVRQIMESAPPQLRTSIDRIVTAGKRLMYDPQTHELMIKQLQNLQAGNVADRLAQGIGALLSMIADKSKGPMPQEAIPPAAQILLCEVFDFLEESGKLEVTEDLVAEATQELTGYVLKKLDYPLAPLVLALVLGDRTEEAFRQSLLISQGSLGVFFSNWLVSGIMAMGFALLLWPLIGWVLGRLPGRRIRGPATA